MPWPSDDPTLERAHELSPSPCECLIPEASSDENPDRMTLAFAVLERSIYIEIYPDLDSKKQILP